MSSQARWFDEDAPLSRRFALYLPSATLSGRQIPHFETLSDVAADFLCEIFGGVTAYPSTGRFRRANGSFQKEAILVLECFSQPSQWVENSYLIQRAIGLLSYFLKQESIACSLDGEMCFVGPIALPHTSPPSTGGELGLLAKGV